MSGVQSYIVRVLRKVEAAFQDGEYQTQRLVVGKAFHRISHADNVRAALERLYAVQGFDRFALRLMWLFEHAGDVTNRIEGAVIDYEVENLLAMLTQAEGGRGSHSAPVESLAPAQAMETFYEALHRFGCVLEEVKRQSFDGDVFRGMEEDSLYRVLSETSSLNQAAQAVGQDDAVRFTTACSAFIQYSLDHSLARDVRVINMLDNANRTLQTVLAVTGTEEYDSLQKNVELLQNPRELLS